MTDRRSGEKDEENERESRDCWVGVGEDIFPIGLDLYPRPYHFYCLYWDVSSDLRMDHMPEIMFKQSELIYKCVCEKVKNLQIYVMDVSGTRHTPISSGLRFDNTDGPGHCNYHGKWVW